MNGRKLIILTHKINKTDRSNSTFLYLEPNDDEKLLDKSLKESKDTGTVNKDKSNIFMCTFVDFWEVDIKKSSDESLNEWIMNFWICFLSSLT